MAQADDVRIYGGNPVTPQEPGLSLVGAAAVSPAPPTRVGLPQDIGANIQGQGAAALAEAQRPRASLWESTKAAAAEWSTTHIWQRLQAPTFQHELGYNAARDLKNAKVQFTLDEEQFLLKAKSGEDYQYRYQNLMDQRDNRKLMGDSPLVAGIVSMADPVYFGIDAVALGLGRIAAAAKTGRTISGLTAGAGAGGVGLIESEQVPVSAGEIVANALLNGAVTAVLTNPRTLAREAAPGYPTQELRNAANAVAEGTRPVTPTNKWIIKRDDAGQPVLNSRGKPVYVMERTDGVAGVTRKQAAEVQQVVQESFAAPARDVPTYRGASGAAYRSMSSADVMTFVQRSQDGMVQALARHLAERAGPTLDNLKVYVLSDADLAKQGAGRERYVPSEHAVYLSHSTSPDIALHEIAHAATVDKIRFGRENAGTATGLVYRELETLRAQAAEIAKRSGSVEWDQYLTKNVEEFVAGLFSGNSTFTDMLRRMPDPQGGRGMLSRAVDAVRRILGFNTTESNALLRSLKLADDLLDSPSLSSASTDAFNAPAAVVGRVDSMAKRTGDTLAWNLHKTLSKWNKDIADRLVDNPLDMTADSAVSQKQAIRNGLTTVQREYEDLLMQEMSAAGIGVRQRILEPTRGMRVQQGLEREVAEEMFRREQNLRLGISRPSTARAPVSKMADKLDELSRLSLEEMQRAGVKGANDIEFRTGYFSRRWDSAKLDHVLDRLETQGVGRTAGMARLRNTLAGSLRRANGWERELAEDVARAILDRTVRKGEFTDSAFRAHAGNEALAEIRDILRGTGIAQERQQRVLDVLAGQVDEAGKAPVLKHRVDLDNTAVMMMPDGSTVSMLDLIDTNLSNITDRYIDTVSGNAALARKGLGSPTEIGALRTELARGVEDVRERAEAVRMFDNVIDFLHGRPVGEQLPEAMRKMQAVTQMVGLSSSGLWQVTEYATAMGKYGIVRTLNHALANLPGFRGLYDSVRRDRAQAEHLSNVLARQSYQDVRMRPYIQRMDDNFEFSASDRAMLGLSQAKQLVPYLNAMKYVHHHQAQMVANLVTDTFRTAAVGTGKAKDDAVRMLEQYGLQRHLIDRVAPDIQTHGLAVDKWSDSTWDAIRGPLGKMMDESVLRNRTGELPAFAQFSQTGKFIFTFRSFVLGAHNKLLAGGLARNGFMGVGLVALYQFPLAGMAVAADSTIKGKEIKSVEELAARAVSQMGVIGLFSDVWGVASGQKQQFGAPGLIALDRAAATIGSTAQGEWGQAANNLINSVPLLPLIPGIKAIGENLK